jgi:hypothetical protein
MTTEARWLSVVVMMVLVILGFGSAEVVAAVAGAPMNLYSGTYEHESIGQGDTKAVQRGVTYQANEFPIAFRLRPPDDHWGGVQYKSGTFRFVQVNHFRTGSSPLHGVGYITIEAGVGSTPSAATTLRNLRAIPHIDEGQTKSIRVAGFAGEEFDASIVGTDRPPICKTTIRCAKGVSLAPFTTNRHCGFCTHTMHGQTQDVKFAGTGQRFRDIVIAVRGKAVVIYLESNFAAQPKLPPEKIFPTFLPYAQRMLANLAFPG